MRTQLSYLHFLLLIVSLLDSALATTHPIHYDFQSCISQKIGDSNETSQVIYTPQSSSYLSVLNFSAQNPRFTTPQTPRPIMIIVPIKESHIQKAILCSRKYGIQIRIRSMGHDVEGLSYVSQVPFAIIDMSNFRSVKVKAKDATAWVGVGATLGEIYYGAAKKSKNLLAFPAGTCPTVGAGGHISGGGIGMLLRKYGLSADNVIDARLIDVNGNVLDRKSMGEDLFWAIRGGGGGSFGVILAWKLKLVSVPARVTVFTVGRTLQQNATDLVYQWQTICNKIDNNLSWRVFVRSAPTGPNGKRLLQASFLGLYLGGKHSLLQLMQKSFPDLGLAASDLQEMSWVESTTYFYTGTVDDLLNRTYAYKFGMKLKSDFVKKPIPRYVFEGIWQRIDQEDPGVALVVLTAFGGRMSEISPSKSPFPHRGGNLYLMEYQTIWLGGGDEATARHIKWTRSLHRYLTPYVSKSPREAYLNYRDLDLGINNVEGNTSYEKAKVWGEPYYVKNFKRLAYVKTLVDPSNFFKFELSIPLVHY